MFITSNRIQTVIYLKFKYSDIKNTAAYAPACVYLFDITIRYYSTLV